LRGLGWTWLSSWGTQLLSWASTIIVARLLSPDDYGLVAMATLFLGLTRLLSEFGLGTTVLTMRELQPQSLREINGLALMLGAGALLVTILAAEPLGTFFESPRLPLVVAAMGLGFVPAAMRVVPYALLQRELKFDTLARLEGVQSVTTIVTTLSIAWFGGGYWALALGPLAGSITVTVINALLRPVGVARPSRSILGALRVSRNILFERLAGYGYLSADTLLIGRLLGEGPLGLYALARSLGAIAVDKVTALTMRVSPAIFSAAQHDPAALRRYLLLMSEGLSIATFPIGIGTALVAPEFVTVLLGDEWLQAIRPLQFIALAGLIPSVTSNFHALLFVSGQSAFVMRNGLLVLLLLPPILAFATRFGVAGVAAAWLLCYPLERIRLLLRLRETIGLTTRSFLGSLAPAAAYSLAMATAVLLLDRVSAPFLGAAPLLASKVALGACCYGLLVFAFHRPRLRQVIALARSMRSR
jgi:O-antigen/teichoic acid export membrane protein